VGGNASSQVESHRHVLEHGDAVGRSRDPDADGLTVEFGEDTAAAVDPAQQAGRPRVAEQRSTRAQRRSKERSLQFHTPDLARGRGRMRCIGSARVYDEPAGRLCTGATENRTEACR